MEHNRFRLLLSSLVALVAIQMQAEAQKLPRLVVCITVDQLSSDYIKELSPMMREDGLKHILSQGKVYNQIAFPLYQPNIAASTASIFTGTYPRQHGIEQSENYNRNSKKYDNIFSDDNFTGSYTRDNFSPRHLLAQTIGDRLKEASKGSSLVYSIAPTAEAAITSAGLLADGAYWIDERIGSWATSSYYPKMLPNIEQYNRSSEGPNKRLTTGIQWKPLRRYSKPEISFSDWGRAFSYRYTSKDIKAYQSSGLVNEEVTNLALRLLEGAGYAQRKSPNLLALSYTAKPYGSSELDVEDVDTYLRLDEEISRLLKALDKEVGLKNCLVTLSGTGYISYPRLESERSSRLKRSLNIGRITALTNMYLTALHGSGDWISSNKNGQLYLNHKTLESKKLNLNELQSQVANFLSASEGLDYAIPAHSLATTISEQHQQIARSVHPRYQADVYWSVLPSWQIEDIADHSNLKHYTSTIPSPFVVLGDNTLLQDLPYEVTEVRDIVRVICSILRIRPPTK